jgi:transcriptional regulator with XRE-family HTH domain
VSYLSELENGRKEPCLRKMKEIAQGLGITLSELLRGSDRGLIGSEGA